MYIYKALCITIEKKINGKMQQLTEGLIAFLLVAKKTSNFKTPVLVDSFESSFTTCLFDLIGFDIAK